MSQSNTERTYGHAARALKGTVTGGIEVGASPLDIKQTLLATVRENIARHGRSILPFLRKELQEIAAEHPELINPKA